MKDKVLFKIYNWISGISGRINSWSWMRSVIILDRMRSKENKDYLQAQLGNPDGDDKPNKKFYDPRAWLRSGEVAFVDRLKRSFDDLNCINRNA